MYFFERISSNFILMKKKMEKYSRTEIDFHISPFSRKLLIYFQIKSKIISKKIKILKKNKCTNLEFLI